MLISDWSSDVCSSDLGLERKTPGRAKEIDQHRQRAVFEIERAHVEPSRIGRAGQHRAEPRFGLAMARERRSGAPLPAARFKGEESVDPRVERHACPPAANADRAQFAKPLRLAGWDGRP